MDGSNLQLLAQVGKATSSILGWAMGLIGLLVVMVVVALWTKKRMSPTQEYQPGGFTLADLRELRRRGAMTEEEFERAKVKVVEGLKAAAVRSEKKADLGSGAGPKMPPGRVE